MKVCTKCKISKELSEFTKDKRKKGGLSPSCKTCRKSYAIKYRTENRDKIKVAVQRSRAADPDKYKAYTDKFHSENPTYRKKYEEENKELRKEQHKTWRDNNQDKITEWRDNNKGLLLANNAKYRASKLQRTPNWLSEYDDFVIVEFYQHSKDLTDATGVEHHVDHIIPLQGELVSGLHTPENLQILLASDNLTKSNSYAGGG